MDTIEQVVQGCTQTYITIEQVVQDRPTAPLSRWSKAAHSTIEQVVQGCTPLSRWSKAAHRSTALRNDSLKECKSQLMSNDSYTWKSFIVFYSELGLSRRIPECVCVLMFNLFLWNLCDCLSCPCVLWVKNGMFEYACVCDRSVCHCYSLHSLGHETCSKCP